MSTRSFPARTVAPPARGVRSVARPAPEANDGAGGSEWELATADGCDRARCAAFLDRLDGLTWDAWLAIGRRQRDADAADPRATAAAAALDRVLAVRGLRVTAWLVRDRIDTAAQVARPDGAHGGAGGRAARHHAADDRCLADAREAAARAALAHLASPWLTDVDRVTLLLPFLTVVEDARTRGVAPP